MGISLISRTFGGAFIFLIVAANCLADQTYPTDDQVGDDAAESARVTTMLNISDYIVKIRTEKSIMLRTDYAQKLSVSIRKGEQKNITDADIDMLADMMADKDDSVRYWIVSITFTGQAIQDPRLGVLIFYNTAVQGLFVASLAGWANSKPTKWLFALVTLADVELIIMFIWLLNGELLKVSGFFAFVTAGGVLFYSSKSHVHRDDYFRVAYLVITVFIIGAGVTFGRGVYEDISPSLGGARAPLVTIALNERDVDGELERELGLKHGLSAQFSLLAQTEKELYLFRSNGKQAHTVRINRQLVTLVISDTERTQDSDAALW